MPQKNVNNHCKMCINRWIIWKIDEIEVFDDISQSCFNKAHIRQGCNKVMQ